MKKLLVFLLAMVLVCSSVLLVACNQAVTDIKIKEDTLPKNVKQGDEINYSSIVIIVTTRMRQPRSLSLPIMALPTTQSTRPQQAPKT